MANEKRLIDAGALSVRVMDASYLDNQDEDVIWNLVQDAPTIDAVEVVRCKDCKQLMLWRKPTDKVIGECFIRKMNSEDEQFCMVGADDFCSYGERKTNERKAD